MAPERSRAVLRAIDPWLRRRGHLFGLAQPAVVGPLRVSPVSRAAMARIDACFVPLAGEVPAAWADRIDPVSLAARAVHWMGGLQRAAGLAVSPRFEIDAGVALPGGDRQVGVVAPAPYADAWKLLMPMVLSAINRAASGAAGRAGLEAEFLALKPRLERLPGPGQNMPFLLAAALELDVPVQRIAKQTLRLGWGCRQRLFTSTLSDRTPAIGSLLARDKLATARLLRELGLPGAINHPVRDADEAVATARRLGYPVVVKPGDRDGGVGVAADLADEAAVRQAWANAAACSGQVLVERHAAGTGHRLTVAHGRVVKAALKRPWGVTGDGQRSIQALVQADGEARAAKMAANPASALHRLPPSTWAFDNEARGLLAQYGLGLESVPDEGRFIALRRRNNAVTGGTTHRLALDAVHPDNLDLAVRAAAALMLDLAGVDLIAPDIGRSWREQAVLICEVNAQPQTDDKTLALILQQSLGDSDCRIPVWLLLLGTGAAAPDAVQSVELMRQLRADGLASAAGVWLGPHWSTTQPLDAWSAAEAVLASREVSRALLVLDVQAVQRQGLPVDRLEGMVAAPDVAALLQAVVLRQAGLGSDAAPARGTWVVAPGWDEADSQTLKALLAMVRPHLAAGGAAAATSDPRSGVSSGP